ncbi:ribonuclease R [Planctomicrobium piriforme]|uniref:Ribonuclease R n=1 Tax=Planctomicrobium piriforme TaxID=1576369 RepID=A0A1I3BJF4_9PLAN|nr:ribonuclease R [Planctomicrobium piriforme]SFH62454.1 ribonuclease R [Planctomicrobium piriforme]
MVGLRKLISEFVQRPGYAAMKPKALAKKLGITKRRMEEFNDALSEAEAAGELKVLESGRVQAKRPAKTYLGTVRKIARGDAFVILHEPKPTDVTGDVYVDARDLKDAQSGDEVLIKLLKRRGPSGQPTGFVQEILQRATNVFVGTYLEEDEAGWVQIDGKDYSHPVWVGDPGAKGAQPGDKVVVEMLRFPAVGQIGEGVLTKVLGARGEPGVDTQIVIHEFGMPDEFPEAVLADARLEAENFREHDLSDREDLTAMTIVTIDPVDARDFDDAISLERWENGHWHLGVHIADVSHFVQPGTALDREAERRGTSVYLPTKVIPMLPEVISNGLASLQANRVRFTMSAFIEFSPEGIPVSTRFSRSAIKVTRRFAYEQVMPILRDPTDGQDVPDNIRKLLADMHELAMLLRRRRFTRGALELDMPEVKLDLDKDGKVTGAHETVHDDSHQIIEEFMLAANIAVAVELNDRGLTFMRRVHADPSPQKLAALQEFAGNLGYPLKQAQSRRDLQNLLKRVKGQPEEHAVNYALLRSLKQAEYSPIELAHYALAEQHYCHFTSPIRRYPDLLIHRLMESVITGHKSSGGPGMEEALRLGRHCSMTERRAERAERELTKIKLLSYFENRTGERMEAIITAVDRYGFFCRGVEIPAEGLVHISTLSNQDYYDFDRPTMSLIARGSGKAFRLGDRVTVEVAHVDVDRRELNFKLVGTARRPPRRPNENALQHGPPKSRSHKKPSDKKKPNKRRRR